LFLGSLLPLARSVYANLFLFLVYWIKNLN
jgi:hypothetical protein